MPNLIKLILQTNGFNSFLALKGIRYEDKHEFFQSLEITVLEVLAADGISDEKRELEAELSAHHQNANNFRLKPGHRNYIMNLMLEIESIDVNEFFGRTGNETSATEVHQVQKSKTPSPQKHEYSVSRHASPNTASRLVVRRSNSDKIFVSSVEHGYSNQEQDQQESEFILEEEEYLYEEDTMDSMIKVEYDPMEMPSSSKKRKSASVSTPSSSGHRRPEQMYNEEFMAKCVNPRRRRVMLNKSYPPTDEGTRERFTDLIHQVIFSVHST